MSVPVVTTLPNAAAVVALAQQLKQAPWQMILQGGSDYYSFSLQRSTADKRVTRFRERREDQAGSFLVRQVRTMEAFFYGPIDPEARFASIEELAEVMVAAGADRPLDRLQAANAALAPRADEQSGNLS